MSELPQGMCRFQLASMRAQPESSALSQLGGRRTAGSSGRIRMAKSAASDAGAYLSDRSVQLHGGIGFTWECDVHIFFKRSLHNQLLYGDGVHQRRKLAELLIGPIEDSI